ncbi:MAG TPA: bifunctional transaldolase/phosoglucose isomerase, partial [Terriglobales bacterium]
MNASRATITETASPLKALANYGQSVWLDYIRRNLITTGELKRLIEEDGLAGVTSNPAIFEKAITGSTDYAVQLEALRTRDLDAKSTFEELAIQDIQSACDIMNLVYTGTQQRDGYVSLEVSPTLARDTQGTLEEARRLWNRVNRPNLMIKVPATPEGIPAIHELISEGINVNVTLLFAQSAYEQVAEAYIAGLEKFAAGGGDVGRVASVASFFISRIDSAIDAQLTAKLKTTTSQTEKDLLQSLLGKVAIANAKLTYQRYKQLFSGQRWDALKKRGAQTQRLLWASTSTKNASYRDVIYVEELIGPDTVNTIPPATFDAFRDHGQLRASLEQNVASAQEVMNNLPKAGISMQQVTDKLLEEGVTIFAEAFEKLMGAIEKSRVEAFKAKIDHIAFSFPSDLEPKVKANLEDWSKNHKMRRLWGRDSSLWTNADESNWLGWLGITEDQLAHIGHLTSIAREVQEAGFTHVALLGMGGSSLCPEVMSKTFGNISGFPELHVLDSTDPAQVKAFEQQLDLKKTIFIVSSKSGSTLEPNIFKQYFFELMKNTVGPDQAPQHFIAITDPGSAFERVAQHDNFRHIYHGRASIGGRYSALSDFGMVPSAVMGVNVKRFLDNTEEMVHACVPAVPANENPGLVLGVILGTHAVNGRD